MNDLGKLMEHLINVFGLNIMVTIITAGSTMLGEPKSTSPTWRSNSIAIHSGRYAISVCFRGRLRGIGCIFSVRSVGNAIGFRNAIRVFISLLLKGAGQSFQHSGLVYEDFTVSVVCFENERGGSRSLIGEEATELEVLEEAAR
jgi:hypothetical protein